MLSIFDRRSRDLLRFMLRGHITTSLVSRLTMYGESKLCTHVRITVCLPAHLFLRKVIASFRYSLNIGKAQEAERFDLEILVGLAL